MNEPSENRPVAETSTLLQSAKADLKQAKAAVKTAKKTVSKVKKQLKSLKTDLKESTAKESKKAVKPV